MATQSFAMVAERLGMTEDELREFIIEQHLPIGGRVNVLPSDKIKLIEERITYLSKQEQRKSREEDEQRGKKSSQPQSGKKSPRKKQDEIDGYLDDTPDDQSSSADEGQEQIPLRKISIQAPISPKDLGQALDVPPNDIIKKLFENGMMVTLNQEVDFETAAIIATDFNVELEEEVVEVPEEDRPIDELLEAAAEGKKLKSRAPVVTIMGHVDHGKTTLLDAIRKTNVVAKEAGGITQSIGAYQVEKKGKKITFIDTPGHEAFTEMRARGAKVTDIAILVVAADDSVQPQTIEAINHARAADVPIVVAINKIDKPEANVDRTKKELADHKLLVEEWGGDTVAVELSAKKGEGIDDLLDMILLVTELQELTAPFDIPAIGTIIESRLDKGKGPVATALVQAGTLKVGDVIVMGAVLGKVRAMHNHLGKEMKVAKPSDPAEIIGLSEVPKAGDVLQVFRDERRARAISDRRRVRARSEAMAVKQVVSLETMAEQLKQGQLDHLNIVLKADTKGSLEAIKSSLEKLDQSEVRINIIHQGIGDIVNSDIALSSASQAVLIGFNIRVPSLIEKSATLAGVDIHLYNIIYKLIEHIEQAIQGIIKAKPKENFIGKLRVKARFATYPKSVIIGGVMTEGYITKKAHAKIYRDDELVANGRIKLLRRVNDEVDRVEAPNECGIQLETQFRKLKDRDLLELYEWEGGIKPS